ncbi:hypothetical protein [Rhodopila sp.]|uniref:hypothetical protein n=1 Tax=Rhodopila sp. TaxID=2480087 RepID=UPI003D0B4BB7
MDQPEAMPPPPTPVGFLDNLAAVTFEGQPIDPVTILGEPDEWADQAALDYALLRQALETFKRSDQQVKGMARDSGRARFVAFGRAVAELRDRFAKLSELLEAAAIRVAAVLAREPDGRADALDIALANGRDTGGAPSDASLILACEVLDRLDHAGIEHDHQAHAAGDAASQGQHRAAAEAAASGWLAQIWTVSSIPAQTRFGETSKAAILLDLITTNLDGAPDRLADPCEQLGFSLASDILRRSALLPTGSSETVQSG